MKTAWCDRDYLPLQYEKLSFNGPLVTDAVGNTSNPETNNIYNLHFLNQFI